MSTTINAVLVCGCQTKIEAIKVPEPRFDPKTGQRVADELVLAHFNLTINGRLLCQEKEIWQIRETMKDRYHMWMEEVSRPGEVLVGKLLAHIKDFGKTEVLHAPKFDSDQLIDMFGEIPRFYMIQFPT